MRWTTWLWVRLLLVVDELLGTHLVEWELAKRQHEIERLVAHIEAVDRDLDALAAELALHQLAMCLIELKARSERSERNDLGGWLCFAPQSDGDESLLDHAIEHLVKPRVASVDVEPDGMGDYIYRLHPDWTAIIARLSSTVVAPELLAWLEGQQDV
jgi:hypothetical protein